MTDETADPSVETELDPTEAELRRELEALRSEAQARADGLLPPPTIADLMAEFAAVCARCRALDRDNAEGLAQIQSIEDHIKRLHAEGAADIAAWANARLDIEN